MATCGNKCTMCHKLGGDVTNYHLVSSIEKHTFWSMDLCIACRDKIFKFIEASSVQKKAPISNDDPDGGEY